MLRHLAVLFFVLFFSSTFLFAQVPGDIVVNEILYNAPTTNSGKEWFEIYNKSSNSINLNNWKWKDNTTTIRTITTQNVTLNPNSFAVVCEDSVALKIFYPNITGIILQSIGWNGLNNTGDQVILYSSSNVIIDSVNFLSNWGGNSNISLERILATGPSNQQSNWGSCLVGATPNKINSLTPKNYDLTLNRLTFSKTSPVIGDTLGIISNIKNHGLLSANTFYVSIFDDYNRDSVPQSNELIITQNSTSPLNPGDSVNFIAFDILDSAGLRQYISRVTFTLDEDTLNNKKIAVIDVGGGSNAGSVVINEIMYKIPSGECEWIELYNNSDTVVNLRNWKIQDSLISHRYVITTNDYFLSSHDYVVISESNAIFTNHPGLKQNKVIIPSTWPLLNDGGDAVTIFKLNDLRVDSIAYRTGWGGEHVSLERISISGQSNDSSNWASSIDCEKSSPARINSITNAQHYFPNDMVVNEIMPAPFTDEAEWIELYNPTKNTINISNWLMGELGGTHMIADTCVALIRPGMYVVFASNDTIYARYPYLSVPDSTRRVFISGSSLGLSNDKDMVRIADIFGDKIDSVYYFDDWYNPNLPSTGVSLEKINPSLSSNDKNSWSSCALPIGGTPGLKNSIYTKTLPSSSEISVYPNPFSPDGDGFEDFTIISYKLTTVFSQTRVKIYDIKGRLVRTLLNNQTLGSSGNIVFDGLDDNKQKLRLGIYIIFFEALNDRNGIVEQLRATIVVAAKL